jgi:hypothetical protein
LILEFSSGAYNRDTNGWMAQLFMNPEKFIGFLSVIYFYFILFIFHFLNCVQGATLWRDSAGLPSRSPQRRHGG